MNIDRRLIRLLKNLRRPFILTLSFALLSVIAIVLEAKYLSAIIDLSFLKKQSLGNLLNLLLIFILVILARFLFQWLSDSFASHLSARIRHDLRNQLVRHLQGVSPVVLNLEKRGELINTLQQGVESLDAYFRSYIPQLFRAAAFPIVILMFVFPIDLLSGFVFLFTAPIIPVFMVLIGQHAKKATQRQWKTLSFLSAYLLDVIEGLTTLKILNRSQSQITRIRLLSEQFRHNTMSVLKIAFLSALVLELAASLSTAVIAVEIGLRLLYAKISFSQALFVLILAPEFYQPMRQLGASFHAGMEGMEAARRIFEIFTIRGRNIPEQSAQLSSSSSLSIELQKVSFRYPQTDTEALSDISLKIEAGKRYVVIGPSGAGKSTLFNLLLKFIAPTQGRILVNGHDLQQINDDYWFKQISWVPQKPYLFHDTIEANLKLVNPMASAKDMVRACKTARLHDFIMSLPDGYQTIVGERGARLSGGQAQRLALARAFLKDAPIILLDEPTANLDPQLDREIVEIMRQFPEDKTQIIIAHRFTTLKNADLIFVLVDGKLTDVGSFAELTAPGKYLHRMAEELRRMS
ncbi:thiol reductant ABC exporter subunit CydD [Caldithrix abyssi]